MTEPAANPIRVKKLGHVGLYCRDLEAMVDFYTRVLGFQVSDTNERGHTFLRFGSDHHGLVLAHMPVEEQQKKATDQARRLDQIGWDGKSRPKDRWRRFTLED